MADVVQEWRTPSPLWSSILSRNGEADAAELVRPAILRFASDSFMDDFLSILEREPSRIDGLVARPETWRQPTTMPPATKTLLQPRGSVSVVARERELARRVARGGAASRLDAADAADAADPVDGRESADGSSGHSVDAGAGPWTGSPPPSVLKLFQPAHQRYYLVTGSLVCRLLGLPDRKLNPGLEERATFVVRRLLPATPPPDGEPLPDVDADAWEEYAFVASPEGKRWRRLGTVASPATSMLVPGEERNALFGARFTADDGRDRRVFAGLVPVGGREAYMAAPLGEPAIAAGGEAGAGEEGGWAANVQQPPDPRLALVRLQVLAPWRNLIDQADAEGERLNEHPLDGPLDDPPSSARAGEVKRSRDKIQTASWYILLDLAAFLATELRPVWTALQARATPAPGSLLEALHMPVLVDATEAFFRDTEYGSDDVADTLADALLRVTERHDDVDVPTDLEEVETHYDRENPTSKWPNFLFPLVDPEAESFDTFRDAVDMLDERLEAELAASPAPALPPALPPVTQTALDARDGWFVIRCVFEQPNCGRVKPPLLSAPTSPFQLAGFFDPDAPARPIQIPLPADTSPAGLRKFAKNTVFQLSDRLCGQVGVLKRLTFGDLVRSVLPWPLHKDLPLGDMQPCTDDSASAGMACSLSIPIVTICAMILLIMIVSLLDFVFKWVPFFISCFPIPGLKGKKS